MHVGNRYEPIVYYLGNSPIILVHSFNDMRVKIDDRLTLCNHFDNEAMSVLHVCAMFIFPYNLNFLAKLTSTYTQLFLDYTALVWSPQQKGFVAFFERVLTFMYQTH